MPQGSDRVLMEEFSWVVLQFFYFSDTVQWDARSGFGATGGRPELHDICTPRQALSSIQSLLVEQRGHNKDRRNKIKGGVKRKTERKS
jgi:hypothetical protein